MLDSLPRTVDPVARLSVCDMFVCVCSPSRLSLVKTIPYLIGNGRKLHRAWFFRTCGGVTDFDMGKGDWSDVMMGGVTSFRSIDLCARKL